MYLFSNQTSERDIRMLANPCFIYYAMAILLMLIKAIFFQPHFLHFISGCSILDTLYVLVANILTVLEILMQIG